MNTLVDRVIWKAKEHPAVSRGMVASGAGKASGHAPFLHLLEEPEECYVMTRRQALLVFNFSRTSVFNPELRGQGGVLWWRTRDETILTRLHVRCVQICDEVGFSEVCVMCEARGPSAPYYWQEMLGADYCHLKKHS
jgi:hypothetical protein